MQTAPSTAVRQITVEKLFARYTYVIPVKRDSSLLILYGDNGSGKTTILKMLFHLLSTARNRGHLTALGAIPFARFEVTLDNGLRLFAERANPRPEPFRYGFRYGNGHSTTVDVLYDEEGGASVPPPRQHQLEAILSHIDTSVGRDVYYIGDDRSLTSDRIPTRETPDDLRYSRILRYTSGIPRHRRRAMSEFLNDPRTADLSNTLERATEWIRSQAIDASRVGTANANQIYTQIIKRIAGQPSSASHVDLLTETLLAKIDELEIRNNDCEPFGLSARFSGNELRHTLLSANKETRQLIIEILQPYLESIEARLNAVSSLQSKLHLFLGRIVS